MADIVQSPIGNIPIINIDSGGLFPPGAAFSIDMSAKIINAAWNLGNDKYSDYEAKVAALTNEVTGWLSTQAAPHITAGTVTTPSVTEPGVDIPQTQSAGDVYTDFAAEYAKIIVELSTQFTTFRSSYFPDEQAAYLAA